MRLCGLHGHYAFGSVAKQAIVNLHVEGITEYLAVQQQP